MTLNLPHDIVCNTREAHGVIFVLVSLPGNFAVWLASAEADFLAGRFVYANWDVDELKARSEEIKTTDLLKIGLIGEPAVRG